MRYHLAATLKLALGEEKEVSVQVLGDAVMAEVTAIGRNYLASEGKGDAISDRHLELSRGELAHLMDALHGKFMLFQDPEELGLTPALVLDDPERRRWGLEQPYEHPYLYVAAMVASVAAIALLLYAALVVGRSVLPHIFHVHH